MAYERWMAIACPHGEFLDKDAFDVVRGFAARWKPKRRFLLGDIYDYAAFRSGARGTADEARRLPPDIEGGAFVIREFRPTDVVIGNHDHRVWKLAQHPNAITALAAQRCIEEFRDACKAAKVQRVVETYDIRKSWIEYGGYKFCHGWMYGENALRDHAEAFGNCVIGHLHVPGMARGRSIGGPVAYCAGTLADSDNLEYAHQRRATLRWALGFLWGEANETNCTFRIEQCAPGRAKEWRLPL